ncbi:MAG: DUF4149 domain-containing protein [Candidatus Limnocylindria bacterium]
MDSLYFDLLKVAFHLGLAVLVGGSLVLGSAAAPAIFRAARSRAEAGTTFGDVLARFDGLAIVSLAAVVATTVLRAFSFEADPDIRIVLRWVFVGLLGASTLYASAWANPVARSIRRQTPGFDDLPPAHLARREFATLHGRSRRAMSATALFGVVVLFFS